MYVDHQIAIPLHCRATATETLGTSPCGDESVFLALTHCQLLLSGFSQAFLSFIVYSRAFLPISELLSP
jgi:hypothetical protein